MTDVATSYWLKTVSTEMVVGIGALDVAAADLRELSRRHEGSRVAEQLLFIAHRLEGRAEKLQDTYHNVFASCPWKTEE